MLAQLASVVPPRFGDTGGAWHLLFWSALPPLTLTLAPALALTLTLTLTLTLALTLTLTP